MLPIYEYNFYSKRHEIKRDYTTHEECEPVKTVDEMIDQSDNVVRFPR